MLLQLSQEPPGFLHSAIQILEKRGDFLLYLFQVSLCFFDLAEQIVKCELGAGALEEGNGFPAFGSGV